jgi:hypothetical protein
MLTDMQTRLAGVEAERDASRGEARDAVRAREAVEAQVAALNAFLAAERARVEEWKAVADRFASQAERLTEAQARRGWWPWRKQA